MANTKLSAKRGLKMDTHIRRLLIIMVCWFIFMGIMKGRKFYSVVNFQTMFAQFPEFGLMSLGVMVCMISSGIDLSTVGVANMTSITMALLMRRIANGGSDLSPVWVLPIFTLALLIGAAAGLLNGVLIAKLKLPPFIATLGTQMMSMGFGSIITKVQSQTWPTATAEVGGWFKKVFIRAELFGIKGFPVGAFWLLGFFIIAALILHKTKFGRYVYAIGSNEEATRLSGINVDNWKVAVYTLSGFFVGMCGLFYAAAYTTITPGTGNGQEMNGITGVIIGGTSMSGGSGTMVGTLIGVFIMSVLKNGLSSCGLQAPWQTFLTGVVVIGAVLLDIARTKAANRVKKG